MSAPFQVNRIVQLVAELTRREADGEPPARIGELAREFGVTEDQVLKDLRTLTDAHDDSDSEWLDHISVILEGDTVQVSSRGAFRRPIRLTAEELLAIQVGMAGEEKGVAHLSAEVTALLGGGAPEPGMQVVPPVGEWEERMVALARQSIDERRLLAIRYTGESDRAGSNRVIEPHDVAYQDGRHYIVAWCRMAEGWRHFRADRVLDADLEEAHFTWRADHRPIAVPGDVFRVVEEPDEVTVRFGAGIARWLLERYPDGARRSDGSLDVVFRVSEPAWLVRHLLQYGPEAEVVAPVAYRAVMRRAVT